MSTTAGVARKTAMQRFLDGVERVGNMVPHPVVIFLILIGIVIALSAVLCVFGAAVRFERINPETHQIEIATTAIRSLVTSDGIRFMYASLIPNFMSFTAVRLMIAAMIGAGVAEKSGLVTALIRKLVIVSPAWALTYILSFVGILSSIAADAGYLLARSSQCLDFPQFGLHGGRYEKSQEPYPCDPCSLSWCARHSDGLDSAGTKRDDQS